jgi:phage-related protein
MPYTFSWLPAYTSGIESAFRVRKVDFGGGYEQRLKDGLFANPRVFRVSFQVNNTVAQQIVSFLQARSGFEAFLWTPPAPYGVAGAFVCDQYNLGFDSWGTKTINATFREVKQVL